MAETTEFVSTIRVKDLISAFESKSESVRVEFTRPRARSVGNILAKNVIVRQNEFNSLDDVQKALKKLDASLNFYEVYNKEKHVAYQEELFNILTSIVNIEGTEEDSTSRKKNLISKTQTLVSFLNQKLPSNANQLTNQTKYTRYSSYIKENGASDTKSGSKVNLAIYSENTKSVDITDSGGEYFVSVRKLKENFQPKSEETTVEEPPKEEKKPLAVHSSKSVENEEINDKMEEIDDEPSENVSVRKLRNLFEKKTGENSKGLGIIADDNEKPNGIIFGSNSNIPYTERNLGSVRLQRSVSGHYMNYVGLLKRIDMSQSTGDLNRLDAKANRNAENEAVAKNTRDTETVEVEAKPINNGKDSRDENSGSENTASLESEEEPRVSVKEIRKLYSNPSIDSSEPKQGSTAKPSHKENVSITTKVEEAKVKYSSATPFSDEQESETDEENDNVATIQGFKEIETEYFGTTSDDRTKDTGKSKGDNLATLQGIKQEILLSTPETSTVKVKVENVSSDEGTEQKKRKIFTAKSSDFSKIGSSAILEESGWQKENSSTVRGPEEEVHYSAAKSSDFSTGESSSVLEGTKMEYVEYSTVNADDIKQGGVEKVANMTGVQEETVHFSTAESENVKSPMYTESISGINLHTTQYKPSEATDNSFTSATIGSDDFYKQESLIEQELDKIKVEPMLADEEIVLNPEDLQNADNEFEKLLEGTESTNIVT